jgi:hypothetical protein
MAKKKNRMFKAPKTVQVAFSPKYRDAFIVEKGETPADILDYNEPGDYPYIATYTLTKVRKVAITLEDL